MVSCAVTAIQIQRKQERLKTVHVLTKWHQRIKCLITNISFTWIFLAVSTEVLPELSRQTDEWSNLDMI